VSQVERAGQTERQASGAPWHALTATEIRERLGVGPGGLGDGEASHRLERFGANRLKTAPRRPAWRRLLEQFQSVLIQVLLVAAVVTALLGDHVDAIVILAVVVINAVIGFIQEGKAESAMAALSKMLALKARVMREGRWQTIDAEQLVPGDHVALKTGDRVPADLRLVEAHGLRAEEAALTGESLPVSKQVDPVAADAMLADRRSMAWAGTWVAGGQGVGVVVATGSATELGRISDLVSHVEAMATPLMAQLAVFARRLSIAIVAFAAVMVGVGVFVHGFSFGDSFIGGVAVAVAAIPEGLPAILTIALAVGVRRMATRHVIVRRLPAVETLGSVDVVCSDKTGTLTRNQLEVARVLLPPEGLVPEADSHDVLEAAVLASDAPPGGSDGDPLERALVAHAEREGLDVAGVRTAHPRDALLPFSAEHKLMAIRAGGVVYAKGAPEAILQRSASVAESGDADYWNAMIEELAREGLRVLAIARMPDRHEGPLTLESIDHRLELLGLVAFEDPPRDEVPAAIASCRQAGIRVKMITGDHPATARAIAERCGIEVDSGVLSGRELDRLDDEAIAARVRDVHVFARTTPEHKLRLVRALQTHGHSVAMTGDGANDAPALKQADIGVAMGQRGTEAARNAAEMVLADDHFASIVAGVEEGRGVYDNLRKAIAFILPTNAAQALVIFVAVMLGIGVLPLTPVLILWVNLVTAVTLALALSVEPREPAAMLRPPRPRDARLLDRFIVIRILWVGAVLTAAAFAGFHAVLDAGGELAQARSMALNVLVAGEIAYLLNCRYWTAPAWQRGTPNPWVWISIAILVVLQAGITYWAPMQAIFGTAGLSGGQWLAIAGSAVVLFLLVEVEKAVHRRLAARRGRATLG
jgi:calcium-translocating P-type ATPase